MKLFDWLFRPTARPNTNPFTIEVEPDDPEELHILAEPRPRPPRRRGRTPEQIEADESAFAAAHRRQGEAAFRLTRDRALSIGSSTYIWRSTGDSDVCTTCAARHGKRFRWDVEPPHGHAGACTACPQGWCRCYVEPVIPKL